MKTPVNNKKELLDRLRVEQVQILRYGVERLGVFGSFARDAKINSESDIDFFVEFKPGKKTFDNFMDLAYKLEELTGRKVELVTAQSLSKYIGPYILKEVEYVSLAA
jgi:predicted nucleotidyltransferase